MTDTRARRELTADDRFQAGNRWLAKAVSEYPKPEAAAAAQIAAAYFAAAEATPPAPKPPVDMDEVRRHADEAVRIGRHPALHVSNEMGLSVTHAKHLVKALDGEAAVQ